MSIGYCGDCGWRTKLSLPAPTKYTFMVIWSPLAATVRTASSENEDDRHSETARFTCQQKCFDERKQRAIITQHTQQTGNCLFLLEDHHNVIPGVTVNHMWKKFTRYRFHQMYRSSRAECLGCEQNKVTPLNTICKACSWTSNARSSNVALSQQHKEHKQQ